MQLIIYSCFLFVRVLTGISQLASLKFYLAIDSTLAVNTKKIISSFFDHVCSLNSTRSYVNVKSRKRETYSDTILCSELRNFYSCYSSKFSLHYWFIIYITFQLPQIFFSCDNYSITIKSNTLFIETEIYISVPRPKYHLD